MQKLEQLEGKKYNAGITYKSTRRSSSHNNFQLCTFDELGSHQLNSRKDFQLEEQYLNIYKAFIKIVPDKELHVKDAAIRFYV